jgi:thiamine transport system substrate-binding protein
VRRLLTGLLLGAVVLTPALVTPAPGGAARKRETIRLVTHDSFAVSTNVLRAFTKRTGITVKILRAGDAGSALNQAILTKDDPLGDVFFGVDTTFLGRALAADVFEPYEADGLSSVPAEFRLDPTHHVTPVDFGDVCINYDRKWFAKRALAVPTELADLTKPAYRGLLVVEDPSTSSPGLAFLLATIATFGPEGSQAFWRDLRANDVKVVDGWEQAYNGQFTAGEQRGSRPLVVSYASSPPAAVYFSDPQPKVAPTGTMLSSCFRQVEFAGILRGAEHRGAARRFVDFLLSDRFQADIPLQMFVFPVVAGTPLPAVFEEFAEVPASPLVLESDDIDRHRDDWIRRWTDVVLR